MPGAQPDTKASKSLRKPLNVFQERLDEFLEFNFQRFLTLDDPELEKAKQQAAKFCEAMASADQPGRWITLLGPSDVGKTMLAKMITRFHDKHLSHLPDERNSAGEAWTRRGGFKSWINVVNDMLHGDYSGIRDMREDWFLALDDIGVEYGRNRELSTTKLYEVLNSREGMFTVVTANMTLDDIGNKMDTRIASRLLRHGSAVINIETKEFSLR